jgi:mRNA interferase MazF
MTASNTIYAFTTDATDAPLFRLRVEPDAQNGLTSVSWLMVDKITTVPKTKIGTQLGRQADARFVHVGLRSKRTAQEGLLRPNSTTPLDFRRLRPTYGRYGSPVISARLHRVAFSRGGACV